MSIVINITTNPNEWQEKECHKIFFNKGKAEDETVKQFIIGFIKTEKGTKEFKIFIRQSVYEKLLSNEYDIDVDNFGKVIIKDKAENEIRPFSRNGTIIL